MGFVSITLKDLSSDDKKSLEKLKEKVKISTDKTSVATVDTFSGTCKQCLTNCKDCTEGWFMTPTKSCVALCDITVNEVTSNNRVQYCAPKSLPLKVTCTSCDSLINKKDGTVSFT